jgi:hypothetical protein
MSNQIKFCSCPMCRRGKHTKYGSSMVRRGIRTDRQQTKVKLKNGATDLDNRFSIPYTD